MNQVTGGSEVGFMFPLSGNKTEKIAAVKKEKKRNKRDGRAREEGMFCSCIA